MLKDGVTARRREIKATHTIFDLRGRKHIFSLTHSYTHSFIPTTFNVDDRATSDWRILFVFGSLMSADEEKFYSFGKCKERKKEKNNNGLD